MPFSRRGCLWSCQVGVCLYRVGPSLWPIAPSLATRTPPLATWPHCSGTRGTTHGTASSPSGLWKSSIHYHLIHLTPTLSPTPYQRFETDLSVWNGACVVVCSRLEDRIGQLEAQLQEAQLGTTHNLRGTHMACPLVTFLRQTVCKPCPEICVWSGVLCVSVWCCGRARGAVVVVSSGGGGAAWHAASGDE